MAFTLTWYVALTLSLTDLMNIIVRGVSMTHRRFCMSFILSISFSVCSSLYLSVRFLFSYSLVYLYNELL